MSGEIKLNLFQRINEIRSEVEYAKKDKSVSTGAGSYNAVTHDYITAITRGAMIKYGIVCYPVLVDSLSNPKEVNAAMEMAKQFRYEATYDFVFVNADSPEDKISIRIQAHAMDNADKAPGKALSYAKKYAILKLFEIESGDGEESRYQDTGLSQDRIDLLVMQINVETDSEKKKSLYKAAIAECVAANDAHAGNAIKEGCTPK